MYVLNGVAVFISWLALRVVLIGWLAWHRLYVHQTAFLALGQPTVGAFLVCYFTSYALQLFWFAKICAVVANLRVGSSSASTKTN